LGRLDGRNSKIGTRLLAGNSKGDWDDPESFFIQLNVSGVIKDILVNKYYRNIIVLPIIWSKNKSSYSTPGGQIAQQIELDETGMSFPV